MKKILLFIIGLAIFGSCLAATDYKCVKKIKPWPINPPVTSDVVIADDSKISVIVYPGTVRTNVERIAKQFGWKKVIWKSPKNFRWVSYTRISGPNFKIVLGKLLKRYPLQAVFYQGNHVLVIQPRTIK